jgi:hypothetical protein
MSKETPASTRPASSTRALTRSAALRPTSPARKLSTQGLIARIWDTLEWRKTLQMACLMVVAGITIFLVLAGLELLTHATGLTAAWPVSISITGTVSFQIGHRQRR